MAIAKGNKSEDVQEFKRYIGISPVFVKGVNPNKAEHEALFGVTLDEAPVYVTDAEDNNGISYKNARVQIVFQMAKDRYTSESELLTDFNNPDGIKFSMALFIQNRPRVGAKSGKTQVIDKYGRTAWATPEELASHTIPMYSNGPADIDRDYRPAYVGEEELIEFIKTYLEIPSITVFDATSKKRVLNTRVRPEECECRLEHIENIFKGDFTEIQEAISCMPTNRIKVLLGIKTDANSGKLYQVVYTRKFLSNKTRGYKTFETEVKDMIDNAALNGRTLNTEYEVCDVHEYSVTPTTFTPVNNPTPTSDMPFDTPEDSTSPWD